jgi:hypothetical protein
VVERRLEGQEAEVNIFAVDQDPRAAAHQVCDLHVRKLTNEAALLINASALQMGFTGAPWPYTGHGLYLRLWLQSSRWAWDWGVEYLGGLLDEYASRYDRATAAHRVHIWAKRIDPQEFKPQATHQVGRLHPAVPEDIRDYEDVVGSYRAYYRRKEVEWHRRCRVHHLAALARRVAWDLPREKSNLGPGMQPRMTWIRGSPRPEWMGPPIPHEPSPAALEMMERWCRSSEGRSIVLLTAEGDGSPPRPVKMIEVDLFRDMALSLAG